MLILITILIAVAVFGGWNALLKTLLWSPVAILAFIVFIANSQDARVGILIFVACLAFGFCFAAWREKQKRANDDLGTYRKNIEVEQYRKERERREFERESRLRAQEAKTRL